MHEPDFAPASVIRRALRLECDGCAFDDEGRFVYLSPTCVLHGQAEAALNALDELEGALGDISRKFTLAEEELRLFRRDAQRWADETYDESMAQRIRERLAPD